MTTVRIARVERRIPPGPVPTHHPSFAIVLADDAGRRELPIWLVADDGLRLSGLIEPPAAGLERAVAAAARTEDELTDRLLRAAGAGVTGVDIDELGPEVTAARIALTSPAGSQHVTARLAEGLAIAITAGAPVRVADTVMDRLAVPRPADDQGVSLPEPASALAVLRVGHRPRYEPRNLAFADGLDGWQLGGNFTEHASHSHWRDYACAAEGGIVVLSAAVPQPAGFAFLGQEIYADDYRGVLVTFRGEFRTEGTAGSAGLFLRINRDPRDLAGTADRAGRRRRPRQQHRHHRGRRDWTSHEVTAAVPDDANIVMFGSFLAGPGRIELRHAELTRGS